MTHLSWDKGAEDTPLSGYHVYRDGRRIDTVMRPTYHDTGAGRGGERHLHGHRNERPGGRVCDVRPPLVVETRPTFPAAETVSVSPGSFGDYDTLPARWWPRAPRDDLHLGARSLPTGERDCASGRDRASSVSRAPRCRARSSQTRATSPRLATCICGPDTTSAMGRARSLAAAWCPTGSLARPLMRWRAPICPWSAACVGNATISSSTTND